MGRRRTDFLARGASNAFGIFPYRNTSRICGRKSPGVRSAKRTVGLTDQLGLMPANLITLPHPSVSAVISLRQSAGLNRHRHAAEVDTARPQRGVRQPGIDFAMERVEGGGLAVPAMVVAIANTVDSSTVSRPLRRST